MISTDVWGTDFLNWYIGNLSVKAIITVVGAMMKNQTPVKCGPLSNTLRAFAQTGNARTAMGIWSDLCAKEPATLPDAFDFRMPTNEIGPFDWRFPSQPGLSIELVEEAGRASLQYENAEQLRVTMATRAAALAAGAHTARIEAKSSGGIETHTVLLQLKCVSANGSVKNISKIKLAQTPASFQVPGTGCVGQELGLLTDRGRGQIDRLIIDH